MARLVARAAAGLLAGMAIVIGVPKPVSAEPEPGTVGAVFTDLCGFVRGDFTNTSASPDAFAFIRVVRDGVASEGGEQVSPGFGGQVYAPAYHGDTIRFEWDVAGGGVEFLEYTHTRPDGCAEPDLSVTLDDDCGPEFTVVVGNSGDTSAEVGMSTPLGFRRETIPVGGRSFTMPAVAGSGVTVMLDHPTQQGLVVQVGAVRRALDCGIVAPAPGTVVFNPSCDELEILFYPQGKGLVQVSRNGTVVADGDLDTAIIQWKLQAQPGDTFEVIDWDSYTFAPPTSCSPAAPRRWVVPVAAGVSALLLLVLVGAEVERRRRRRVRAGVTASAVPGDSGPPIITVSRPGPVPRQTPSTPEPRRRALRDGRLTPATILAGDGTWSGPKGRRWRDLAGGFGSLARPLWPVAERALTRAAGTVLDVDVPGLLLTAWHRYAELDEALRSSRQSPGSTVDASLVSHEVRWSKQSRVDLLFNDTRVASVEIELAVVAEVASLSVSIRDGQVVAINSGVCEVRVELSCAGIQVDAGIITIDPAVVVDLSRSGR